jgi:hypothetical protein
MAFRVVLSVGALFMCGGLAAQSPPECTNTRTTVELENPDSQRPHFFWLFRNYVLVFRPEAVLDFWTTSNYAQESWARVISDELPLQQDQDLAELINERILQLMAASLIQAGTASVRGDDGYLDTVIVEETSGPPCNSQRLFLEADGTDTPILRVIDFML